MLPRAAAPIFRTRREVPQPHAIDAKMPPPMLLNDGTEMPQIAYGLYQVKKDEATRCVADAIKAGYAHFDGAAFYDNEREAGLSLTEECWYTT